MGFLIFLVLCALTFNWVDIRISFIDKYADFVYGIADKIRRSDFVLEYVRSFKFQEHFPTVFLYICNYMVASLIGHIICILT